MMRDTMDLFVYNFRITEFNIFSTDERLLKEVSRRIKDLSIYKDDDLDLIVSSYIRLHFEKYNEYNIVNFVENTYPELFRKDIEYKNKLTDSIINRLQRTNCESVLVYALDLYLPADKTYYEELAIRDKVRDILNTYKTQYLAHEEAETDCDNYILDNLYGTGLNYNRISLSPFVFIYTLSDTLIDFIINNDSIRINRCRKII